MEQVTNEKLVETIKSLRGEEKRVVAELIRYLHELDKRRYFRELGYSSLHSFCTNCLGYSDSAAWRRISAARALDTCPELSSKIEEGEISLCNASQISRVFTPENKEELFKHSAGKSSRELEKLLVNYLPEGKRRVRSETVKVRRVKEVEATPLFSENNKTTQPEPRYTVVLDLSQAEMALIEEAQKILSASKVKDTLLTAARKLVVRNQKLTAKRDKRTESLPTSDVALKPEVIAKTQARQSRYISADVKHAVQKRDGRRCTFVAADGSRCAETRQLQFDHLTPFALGGETTTANPSLFRTKQLNSDETRPL